VLSPSLGHRSHGVWQVRFVLSQDIRRMMQLLWLHCHFEHASKDHIDLIVGHLDYPSCYLEQRCHGLRRVVAAQDAFDCFRHWELELAGYPKGLLLVLAS
jgi:hypothetical protein